MSHQLQASAATETSKFTWFWCKMCRRNFPNIAALHSHKRMMHPQLYQQPKESNEPNSVQFVNLIVRDNESHETMDKSSNGSLISVDSVDQFFSFPELMPKTIEYYEKSKKWTNPSIKSLDLRDRSSGLGVLGGNREASLNLNNSLEEILKVEEILSKYVVPQTFEGEILFLCRLCMKPFSQFLSATNHVRTHSRRIIMKKSNFNRNKKHNANLKVFNEPPQIVSTSSEPEDSKMKRQNFDLVAQKGLNMTRLICSPSGVPQLFKDEPEVIVLDDSDTESEPTATATATTAMIEEVEVEVEQEPEVNFEKEPVLENEEKPEIQVQNNFKQWYLVPKSDDEDDHDPKDWKSVDQQKDEVEENPKLKSRLKFKINYFPRRRGSKVRYVCRFCRKEFQSVCRINWHLPVHTGERNFKCRRRNCPRSFANVGNQLKHEKRCQGVSVRPKMVKEQNKVKSKAKPEVNTSVNKSPSVALKAQGILRMVRNSVHDKNQRVSVSVSMKRVGASLKTRSQLGGKKKIEGRTAVDVRFKAKKSHDLKDEWAVASETVEKIAICLVNSVSDFYGPRKMVCKRPSRQTEAMNESEEQIVPMIRRSQTLARTNISIKVNPDDGKPRRYCLCQQFCYGKMIACDNPKCPSEWFHFGCVGLDKQPNKSFDWYCPRCSKNL